MGQAIEDLNNDYCEDPAWSLEGMRRVRESVRIPTASHQVGVNFGQLTQNVRAIAAADDIIKGGKMKYRGGKIAVPQGPGLGVELDRDKLAENAELQKELGGYAYARDPAQPGGYAILLEQRRAVPCRR